MDYISKKIKYYDKKFGIIKNNYFNLNDIINIFKNKSNLIIIPNKFKMRIKSIFKIPEKYFFKRNTKLGNNIIITDICNTKLLKNRRFDNLILYLTEYLNIKKILYKYKKLWLVTNNTDLIYFNNKNFLKQIVSDLNFNQLVDYIIESPKCEIEIIKKYTKPTLDQQLNFINEKSIDKNIKKLIKNFGNKNTKVTTCNICFEEKDCFRKKCCNKFICHSCYFKNKKKYNKCPYCRFKYKVPSIKFNENGKIILSKFRRNLNKDYNELNLNKNIVCYYNKNSKNNKILCINLSEKLINNLYNRYFKKYKDYQIINYIPKFI